MTAPGIFKASDIITDALQKLGVYSPSEQIADSDMARGLIVLNDMIDQWQNEFVFIYSLTTYTINLAVGVQSYPIGPPGYIRPNRIQNGPGGASATLGSSTYSINVVSVLEWGGVQGVDPGRGIPDTMYYDPQYPVGMLNLAPVPNVAMVLSFYSFTPFYSFANYSTSAAFSHGTIDALKDNLAVYAKPYFMTAQLDPIIASRAETTKEFLRTTGTISRALIRRSPSDIGKPPAQVGV